MMIISTFRVNSQKYSNATRIFFYGKIQSDILRLVLWKIILL